VAADHGITAAPAVRATAVLLGAGQMVGAITGVLPTRGVTPGRPTSREAMSGTRGTARSGARGRSRHVPPRPGMPARPGRAMRVSPGRRTSEADRTGDDTPTRVRGHPTSGDRHPVPGRMSRLGRRWGRGRMAPPIGGRAGHRTGRPGSIGHRTDHPGPIGRTTAADARAVRRTLTVAVRLGRSRSPPPRR
jgi:hypothetical protein